MTRILHLSDLHLGTSGALPLGDYTKTELLDEKQRLTRHDLLRGTLDALAGHLRKSGEQLDAVVVSGDVSVQGSQAGFTELHALLDHLGDRNPGPAKTVVVPGNHDVSWRTAPDSEDRYRHFLDFVRSAGYVTPLLEGIDISSSDGSDIGSVRDPFLDLDDTVIVALNSSNFCGTYESLGAVSQSDVDQLRETSSGDDPLARLLKRFDELRLVDLCKVSKGQTEAVGQRLQNLDDDGIFRLKVVVMHHQLLPVNFEEEVKPYETMTNLGFVRQWLVDQGVHLVLHGHKHSAGAYIDVPGVSPFIDPGLPLERRFVMVSSVATANREKPVELGRIVEINSSGKNTRSLSICAITPTYPKFGFGARSFTEVAHAVISRENVAPRIKLYEGNTVDDVYSQLLIAFPPDSYEPEADVICRIVNGDSCHHLPEGYPVPEGEDPEEWLAETVEWWQNPEPQLRAAQFNHGERIWRYSSNVDQFALAVKELARRSGTSRSIMVLIEPQSSLTGADPYPSLCLVQLRIPTGTGRLDCIAYFRKQQMRAWWPINVGELASIQSKVIRALSGIVPGEIVTISALALGGSDRPRVAVPRIDRWSQDKARLLWELALDTLNSGHSSHATVKERWVRLFSDWRPGPEMESDGVPVALWGLDALADAVETCALTFANSGADNLVTDLRDLSRINDNYWNHDSTLSDDDTRHTEFRSWQPTADLAIARVLGRVDEVLASSTMR